MSAVQVESIGTASSDTLNGVTSGASTNDILDGRAGNDDLYGNYGGDTYYFSLGTDEIYEQGGTDIIKIREGWTPGDISVYRAKIGSYTTQLVVADTNGNKIVLDNHFTSDSSSNNSAYSIEQIVFANSTTWTLSSMEIETRGTSSTDTLEGATAGDASSDDRIFGYAGNDYIYSGAGNDYIDGGDDNDSMYGEGGNDTYVAADGVDYVSDNGGTDILHVTGGATINDISFADQGYYDTRVIVTSSVDEVRVAYLMHVNANYHVESIRFDDGFTTSLPDYLSWLNGTSGNDTIAGNSSDNTLIGFAGNDNVSGGSGNDDMHGGAGNDTLDGDDGTDLLYGGTGDDLLYGEGGLDTLHGGAGADTFRFHTASAFSDVDVIRDFSAGGGDIIDLTDILSAAYDPLTDDIADFISFSESTGSTFVSVDRDGTGGTYSMAQIIKLESVTGLAAPDVLETNGNLIAA